MYNDPKNLSIPHCIVKYPVKVLRQNFMKVCDYSDRLELQNPVSWNLFGTKAIEVVFMLWFAIPFLSNSWNAQLRSSFISSENSWNVTIVDPCRLGF